MRLIRGLLFALSLLAFLILSFVANVGLWGLTTFLDSEAFATTTTRIIQQPEVRATLAARIADRLTDLVVPDPGRVPVVVRRALQLTGSPSVDVVRSTLTSRLDTLLADPTAVAIEQDALADLHRAVLELITRAGAVDPPTGITLDLGGVVDALDARIDPGAPGFLGQAVPADLGVVTITEPSGLATLASVLHLLEAVRWLLPALAVVAALLVLLLARARLHAIAWLGLCLLVVGAGCLLAASGAPIVLARLLGARADPLGSAQAAIDGLLGGLITQSVVVAGLGLALLVVGVTAGIVTSPDASREPQMRGR